MTMNIINIQHAVDRRIAEVQQFQREWNAAEIQANAARLAFDVAPLQLIDTASTFAQRVQEQA